jgi:group I intron endonuclease
VYILYSSHSGEFYIGSTNNFRRRRNEHFSELRGSRHGNQILQRIYNKYGKDCLSFIVLDYEDDKEKRLVLEQEYLDTWNPEYNIAENVSKLPDHAGEKHPVWGKHHREESKKKTSMTLIRMGHGRGKKLSEETKQKLREKLSGKNSPWWGKHHTLEQRKKVRGENNYSSKLTEEEVIEIINKYRTGKYIYKELSDEYGVGITQLSRIVRGESWSYLSEAMDGGNNEIK